ncbi:MAG TPA: DNA translocase FtsK 4TM domain-containing protein [Bauldia sp.]|nr:DNA translocase FtsK 4TM domain-containing protein [Bauldia sp.]
MRTSPRTTTRSLPFSLAADGTIRRLIRRNLSAILGLSVLALAAAFAASLATWAVDDPSFSHATDHGTRNILGFPGAVIADLLTQLLGLASSLFLLPPVVWAWRAVFANPSRLNWKTLITWLLATLSGSITLASLPAPNSWPLPTGLGGVIGDLLLKLPAAIIGHEPVRLSALATGVAFAALTLLFALHACGLILQFNRGASDEDTVPAVRPSARVTVTDDDDEFDDEDEDADMDADDADGDEDGDGDEDDDDRPSRLAIFAGILTHVGMSLAASMRRRLLNRRRSALRAMIDEDAFRAGRIEPRMGADGDWHAAEPDMDVDMDEDDADLPEMEMDEDEAPVAPRKKKAKPAAPAVKKSKAYKAPKFELPPVELLAEPKASDRKSTITPAQLEANARALESVLDDFGVKGEIINAHPGPVVTLYELEPAPGIKSARVIGLADDIARSMSAIACRVAVIPGKNAIGIELPNAKRETVFLRELLAAQDFADSKAKLGLCLGKNIGGEPVIADLARMPHLLVAGTTGSGKSVSINTMILSLLYKWTPAECRMIMIDPKMLELSIYDGIPHLLTPVVTDPKQAVVALKWTVREMEDRYRKMSKLGVRNVDGYNARVAQALAKGETLYRTIQTGFDKESGEAVYEKEALSLDPMPYIVVIIDEMADLMMVAGKDIEGAVQRLAQMARAAGIHVVMATQRPSVDVITGTIKANFPTRISFQVTSKIDSRTILGEQGAEQLLGQGDMLYMAGGGRITRVHGPFVSDKEVEEIVAHLKSQGAPEYLTAVTVDTDAESGEGGDGALFDGEGGEEGNDLYDKAVAIVLRDRKASTSYIQRRLGIGYNKAASIIEKMEHEGVVGPANHAGKRDILVPEDEEAAFR